MSMDRVILVDQNDREIGLAEKMKAHKGKGMLHRAISVYIFNSKGQLMIQQRAKAKYHSGLLWTNTCWTNCYEGESADYSAHRSLKNEMGFDCKLKEVFSLVYRADVGQGLTEYEFLHVFFGVYDKDPRINPDEAKDWKWIGLRALKLDIKKNSKKYTAWFKVLVKYSELYDQAEKFVKRKKAKK